MKRIIPVVPVILMGFVIVECYSQNYTPVGPRSTALAKIQTIDNTSWASLGNVANLANQQGLALGLNYERQFDLKELSVRMLGLSHSGKLGSFGGIFLQSGYKKSLFNRYGISYSRKFGKGVAIGMQFNYLTHQLHGVSPEDALYISLGGVIDASHSFTIGFNIQNPEQSKIKYDDVDYSLPSLFAIGVEWSPDNHIKVLTEVEKAFDYQVVYKGAVQLDFKKQIFLRGGVVSRIAGYTFGAGFKYRYLIIDAGFYHHSVLGITSSFGLAFKLSEFKSDK